MGRAEPGCVLAARYQLRAVSRRDEMGIVWLARDGLLHRDVAVKVAPLPGEAGQESPQRVFRDARALARLDHPNIPVVFDIVEDDGSTWMVLQAAPFRPPYRSLGEVVRNDGPLPPERAAEAGFQILSALRAAHAVGVRHGDIRPGNVLLGPGNWAMLAGFGMVTADDGRAAAGAPGRSPCYLAPERASGQPVTLAADLWSLGATLYAAVEGRPPFHGDGPAAVRAAVVSGHPGSAPPRGPALAGGQRPAPQGRGCPARRRRRGLAAPARGRWPRCRGTDAAGRARRAVGRPRPGARKPAGGGPRRCAAGYDGRGPARRADRRRASPFRGGLHSRVRPPRARARRGSRSGRRSPSGGAAPRRRAPAPAVVLRRHRGTAMITAAAIIVAAVPATFGSAVTVR